MSPLWPIRILFLLLCTAGGYAVSQVRPEYIGQPYGQAIGMVIGLVISLIQAVTRIQEQTLAFVPKIFAMAIAIIVVMPWMFNRLLEYTHHLFTMAN